jgi:UDP-N-acetylglucosamine diphosphorylase / glucose-1-phosphate thymidylyltransferase / UDP-N-acetylgalactosamine diphosphorylase / glucosamine-1-phosphate N-acetyltransferase / galactosamine-1-phosphate N-acetyltransferase
VNGTLLAAGRGTRLGELTADLPKPLLDVGGKPIIVRIIEGLRDAGVIDLTIVVGYRAEQIEEALGDGGEWGLTLRCIRQESVNGTATALQRARPYLNDAPFFVGWGDIVVDAGNYRRVVEAAEDTGAALAMNSVDDPWAGGAVYVDEHMRVTRVVEKPPKGTSTTQRNNAGLCVLRPDIWQFIEALEPSARGEYELPQAIAAMIEAGVPMVGVAIDGPWFDIGTPENLKAARAWFSS